MLLDPHPDIAIGSGKSEREIKNLVGGSRAAWCTRVHERLQQRRKLVNKYAK